eukprot:CAMPEP_0181537268 /NCGR_PEP_ID=MMETSP1110-20121109/75258_1 /TAXON_ID=174948 /ORGANISM="Symbiodinium sp., Strain CCMP421" /LENGTH=75 /DNA_ID=CAMNT_0023668823 /DNA_START=116 /DNA_END=340 /DNA_ORIENTATION=+
MAVPMVNSSVIIKDWMATTTTTAPEISFMAISSHTFSHVAYLKKISLAPIKIRSDSSCSKICLSASILVRARQRL